MQVVYVLGGVARMLLVNFVHAGILRNCNDLAMSGCSCSAIAQHLAGNVMQCISHALHMMWGPAAVARTLQRHSHGPNMLTSG